jgi:hypothetical protein
VVNTTASFRIDALRAGRRVGALLVALATLAIAATALAQSPGGQGGGRGGMPGGPGGQRPQGARGMPVGDVPLNPGALVQRQLDELEDDLQPTAAQSGAWSAYADALQKLADDVERGRFEARTTTPGQASAPQQLEQIAAGARRRMALVESIVELGRTFYATLSAEQKAIADRRMGLPLSLLATGVAPTGTANGAGRGEGERKP